MPQNPNNRQTPRFALRLAFGVATVAAFFAATLAANAAAPTPAEEAEIIAKRAVEILPTLSDAASTVGDPSDRAGWERLTAAPDFASLKRRADSYLESSIPDLPEALYREFFVNGNRSNYQKAYSSVYSRIAPLAIAEAVERKGRYIPALEELARYLCAQPSWLLPAHDRKVENYEGKAVYSDLVSTLVGAQLAVVARWFDDELSPEVRDLIVTNVEKRVLQPYEIEVKTRSISKNHNSGMWWVRGTNNWNAVCTAGTLAAALYVVDDKERRAWFVAAADYFSEEYFIPKGFTSDGYCTEGLSYWNYGFGYYVYLAALASTATNGQVDLLRFPKVRAISEYAPSTEIANGRFLAFADCGTTAKPSSLYAGYLSRALGLGFSRHEEAGLNGNFRCGDLLQTAALGFDDRVVFAAPAKSDETANSAPAALPLRTDFPSAGVLICRPSLNASGPFFAAALKGGHNNELHNHNDVGSYSLLRGVPGDAKATGWVSQDPGGETYTRRTFSAERYEGELLNSFGHPVPRIAGKLQSTGAKARGVREEIALSDAEDRLRLDLTSAYDVPELKRAERLFVFTREQTVDGKTTPPTFRIEDAVEFTDGKTADYETALITFEKHELVSQTDGELVLSLGGARVKAVARDRNGASLPLVLEAKIVGENDPSVPKKPTRLALKIAKPVANATITTTFELE